MIRPGVIYFASKGPSFPPRKRNWSKWFYFSAGMSFMFVYTERHRLLTVEDYVLFTIGGIIGVVVYGTILTLIESFLFWRSK